MTIDRGHPAPAAVLDDRGGRRAAEGDDDEIRPFGELVGRRIRLQAHDCAAARVDGVDRSLEPSVDQVHQDRAAPLGGVAGGADDGDGRGCEHGVQVVMRSAPAVSAAGVVRGLGEDHQRVGGDQVRARDEQRVHVDLGDLRVVRRHLRDRPDDPVQLIGVDSRQAAEGAEQALRAELGRQRPRIRLVQRRERERHVGDRLREDAAEAEGDHGAELRVTAHADEQLALVRHELLDEHAALGSSGRAVDDAVVGGARSGRVPHVELDQPEVALVLDVGAERLEHGRAAQGLDGGRGSLRVVHDGPRGGGHPVHGEEELGLLLVERRPSGVERPADHVATGSAHPAPPEGGILRLSTPPALRRTGRPPGSRHPGCATSAARPANTRRCRRPAGSWCVRRSGTRRCPRAPSP